MAIQVKFRRGTATQHNSFTGANGEITVDTTNKTLRIHDGVTVGGIRIAKFSEAGGNTSSYLQVANAAVLYTTKAYAAANSYVKSTLANTNSFIATKLNTTTFNSALANTNSYIASRASWSSLTSTNTALRVLISDRLQVANAVATYQTKTIERAALANTNSFIKGQLANTNAYIAAQASRITLVNTNLLATNTALRSLISSQVSSVIGASPDALNTLQELANALGNNANFATATTNLIATKISVANTKVYLANTNAFIKTQLANTNLSIATRASWTALAGTNTALRTLISDRLQVANAAAIYQTKAVERAALANTNLRVNLINTNLTVTNTALRTLISDRLQVANAATTYQTKAVERAALANTNLRINLINTNLTGTNTSLRTLISDRLQVANATTLLAAKATWTGLTTTNTALRTLISDRLQVANASSTYLTKNNPLITGTLTANGSAGTSGYYLRTSGAGIYWSPVSGGGGGSSNAFSRITVGANTAIADSVLDTLTLVAGTGITIAANPTTDTITFSSTGGFSGGTVASATTFSSGVTLSSTLTANGSAGTSGYYLRTSGTGVYWSPVAAGGGGTFTGGTVSGATTFSSGVTLSSTLTAGASVGTSGQALVSTGTGVQWGVSSPGYNYSSQFGGGNQYLGITTSNAAFGFGTGEFTIEGWFYPTLNPANGVGTLFEFRTGPSSTALALRINTSLQLVFYDGPLNTETTFTTRTISLNAWQHIALVRIGNTVYGYINGLLAGSVAVTSNLGSSQPFYIGTNQTAGYNYYGLASNVRVVKGTGIYTAAFTPPTSPLSAISGTSVLTCNAITPTSDSSTNAFQFTNVNGVTATATQSPFTSTTVSIPTASLTAVRQQFTGDGSTTSFSVAGGYTPNAISVFVNGVLLRNGTEVTVTNGSTVVFAIAPLSGALIDVIGTVPTTYSSITPVSYSTSFSGATGQYLSVPANAALSFGTGDLTIECWAYFNDLSDYRSLMVMYPVSGVTTGAGWWALQHITTTNKMGFYYNGGTVMTGTTTLTTGTWYHVAMVRSGSTVTGYINGQSQGTATYSGTFGRSDNTLYIGAAQNVSTARMNGYISNVRITKGVAVYTGAFTPPQTPLAIVQSATNPSISAITGTQTSLLTCNGPTIIDGSTNAFTITNNGSAPVSTAIVPTFTNVTINNPSLSTYQAAYLVVAGGGGGGFPAGGGGGAGGLLTNSTLLTIGTTYTITVGAGGNGGLVSGGVIPTIGTNSVMSGAGLTTITAFGGGGGGSGGVSTGIGSSGGSGGGAGNNGSAASGSTGTSGQGFAGGNNVGASPYPSGGGGGAGAAGSNASGSASGAGGAGVSSSITGSSVTYAGGGGGAGTSQGASAGAGGVGGGGAGGGAGVAGTTNTGGGGGGASNAAAYNGGAGGSGVVILAVPYANYTGTTTGSPTVTTVTSFSGTYKILTFTASGSYTA